MWLEVHDVASAEPGEIAVVLLIFVVLNLKQGFFGFFEFFRGGRGETKVPVEIVIIDEIWSDRFQVDKYIVELFQNEEALSHALTAGNGIAFGGRGADHLEEVLRDTKVILLLRVLSDDCVYDSLQDVFFGNDALHVLN